MRLVKKILALAATLAGVATLGLGGLFVYASTDRLDTFYVLQAELSDPDYLHRLEIVQDSLASNSQHFGFSAQRLKPGKGAVLGYRFFSPGDLGVIDDETYRKVTVWIPAETPLSNFNLSAGSGAIVLYSEGSSAWPRNDCSGRLSAESLRIDGRGKRYMVAVHGQLQSSARNALRKGCDLRQVDIEFTAAQLSFDQITPWLGSEARHPYEETYR